MDYKKIYFETDLSKHSIAEVSKKIPSHYCNCIEHIHILMDKAIMLKEELAILELRIRKDLIENSNFSLKNDDKEIYCNGNIEIAAKKRDLKKQESEITKCESLCKYLTNLNMTIKNIIDYEKLRNGV